jgi:hypothetical protein
MTFRRRFANLFRRAADRLEQRKKGLRNPRCAEANTHRRHAEVGAFLNRNRHITDFARLAEIAVNEGLYSRSTSKCDIVSRLERFESLHGKLKFRELLRS